MNNDKLIAAGREFRDMMTADTALIDIAKMISNLATQLDLTTAALREKTKQCDALAVENAQLKQAPANNSERMLLALDAFQTHGKTRPDVGMQQAFNILLSVPTPATDAAIASIQAQGVEKFADDCDSDVMLVQPEDAEHYELMAEHARQFAAQLRKGEVK